MKYIYQLTNKITNGIYIGQTTNPRRRMWEHKSRSNTSKKYIKLYQAINEYGFENFEMTILEKVPDNQSNQKEAYYIDKYNATSPENYNTSQGHDLIDKQYYENIISDYQNGLSASAIGKKYNVKHPQIIQILKNQLGEKEYYRLSKSHTNTKKNIPIEDIVDLIENQNKTKKETAQILGVCDSTIVRRYNKWKSEQDPNFTSNPHKLGARKVDENLIINTYSKLKSTRKTAVETGYSRSTVRRYLKKANVL